MAKFRTLSWHVRQYQGELLGHRRYADPVETVSMASAPQQAPLAALADLIVDS